MDYTVKIGGEAGQGLVTVGEILSKVFATAGYHVFSHQDYESRVRGGHNFYQIRVSEAPVSSSLEKIDIVVAMDRASIELHGPELTDEGFVIYDSEALNEKLEGNRFIGVPFRKLATEDGGSPVMANTVATGAALGMLGMDIAPLLDLIEKRFRKKGDAIVEGNVKAARAGYGYAKEHCPECRFLPAPPVSAKIMLTGIEAIELGAISAGLKFYSAYPMTPSTGIMNNLSARAEKYGIVVEQAEDEIAAINMALGASFAGVRAMTGTSGGGLALMVEGLSLAGITETPIVIAEGQRPGPATGFPTRTEQGDLLFILHTGHGEFPRIVFAPGTPQEALNLTNRAFELAEKYQVPVFVVFDQYLADCQWTYESLNTEELVYKDYRLRGDAFASQKEYKRYAYTESGVTPLGVPGDAPHVVVADSDEHDEEGHIVEDAETRIRMTDKRLFKKLAAIKEEIRPPLQYGNDSPDTVLVGWGSTYGVIKEAVDALNERGDNAAMLHFSELYPFPARGGYMKVLEDANRTVCIENNATGQFARHMSAETGYEFALNVNRYDGRPFTVDYILRGIEDAVS
jgi:2-oxoglutarate ferredoxin oxidoreductase subunit alpha